MPGKRTLNASKMQVGTAKVWMRPAGADVGEGMRFAVAVEVNRDVQLRPDPLAKLSGEFVGGRQGTAA